MSATKKDVSVQPLLERRGQPRLKTSRAVTLQALPKGRCWEACILDISASGARLRCADPVPAGTSVRLDGSSILLFGEVVRCVLDDGAYMIGMKFSRPLTMLAELQRLNTALFGEDGC